jgi:pimeloyl-ACP methyl ester carboxylesterase
MMQQQNSGAQILRGFASIREGQVHYRSGGESSTARPLWMVHASPASSVTLVPLMRELGRSRRVIAPDTLGNGDSAPPAPQVPDMTYYADASLRVMDALGIDKADLYGSHTGAHIVTEMALARPDRFGRMILDGIGMFSPEDKAELLARYAPSVQPDSFGTQFHWAWHFVRDQAWFFPYFRRDAAHLRGLGMPGAEVLHQTTLEVLKAVRTYHHAYRAAFAHPDRERLPLVQLPTLVMADASDPLREGVASAAQLLPGARSLIWDDAANPGAAAKARMLESFLDGS